MLLPTDMYSPFGEKLTVLTRPRGVAAVGQFENAVPEGRWYSLRASFFCALAVASSSPLGWNEMSLIGVVRCSSDFHDSIGPFAPPRVPFWYRLTIPVLDLYVSYVSHVFSSPNGREVAAAAHEQAAVCAVVLPLAHNLALRDVPDLDLVAATSTEHAERLSVRAPDQVLDRTSATALQLPNDDTSASRASPLNQADAASSSSDGEDSSVGREGVLVERIRTCRCRRRTEEVAGRANARLRREVVGVVEGAVSGQQKGRSRGMEGRALEGKRGDVEGDEGSVRVAVNVEETHAPVSTGDSHDGKLRARVPGNIDDTGAGVRRLLLAGRGVLLVGVH